MTEEEKRAKEMEDAIKAADAKKLADAAETGQKLDKMLSCLDALTTGLTTLGQRMDAYDVAEKVRKDESLAHESTMEQNRRLADEAFRARTADDAARADAQARADTVFSAFGGSAPRPLDGETLPAYRVRLAVKLQDYSAPFKGVDLKPLAGTKAFDAAETIIYDAAVKAANNPIVAEGRLEERYTTDQSGRRITTFHGRPSVWMSGFSGQRQRLIGIRNRNHPE